MKFFVIGDEDTVLGLGMVGVKGIIADKADEADYAFREALKNKDAGIILITDRLAELIRPLVDRYIFREKFPLVVEIPDRTGPSKSRQTIRELVNSAIGVTV